MITVSINVDMTTALNSLEIALSDVDNLLLHHEKRGPAADGRPESLRTFVRKFVHEDPWRLAGEGWRKATVEAVETRVHGNPDSGSFGMNNANPKTSICCTAMCSGFSLWKRAKWESGVS
jgi:hypothetical protein